MIDIYRYYTNRCVVSKNKELLHWLRIQTLKGYKPYIGIDELQDIICTLTNIYEKKYPNFQFGHWSSEDSEINCLLNLESDFCYICNELSLEQFEFIEGYYSHRSLEHYQSFFYDNDVLIPLISVVLPCNDSSNHEPLLIQIRTDNGLYREINAYSYFNQNKFQDAPIDFFLEKTKKQKNYPYDISILDKIVREHNNNLILRKKVLHLTALNIMLSSNTNLEYGYERAKKFILDFNNYIPDLNLDFSEINFIFEKLNPKDTLKASYIKKKYA